MEAVQGRTVTAGNMETSRTRRNEGIDIARGIAILLVMLGHLVTFDSYALRLIFSFHMPFFFLISGYCTSLDRRPIGFWKYCWKLFLRLGIPTLIFRFILLAQTAIRNESWNFTKTELIKQFLDRHTEWFLPTLFFVSILLFLYIAIDKRLTSAIEKLILGVSIVMLCPFFAQVLFDAFGEVDFLFFPFKLTTGLCGFAFAVIGYWSKKLLPLVQQELQKIPKWRLCLVVLVPLALLPYGIYWNQYVNFASMIQGKFTLFTIYNAAFLSLLTIWLGGWLSKRLSAKSPTKWLLKLFGRNSLLVYLGHSLIYPQLRRFMYLRTGNDHYVPMENITLKWIVIFFCVTVLILIPVCLLRDVIRTKRKTVPEKRSLSA